MKTFLLWLLLFVVSWPLALLALVLYPFVWLLLIPFRLLGIAIEGLLGLVKALFLLPARLLGART
jgi:hypothetical protein